MESCVTCALVVLLITNTVNGDYCHMPYCQGDHIACDNNEKFAAACPNDAKLIQLTEADKIHIVKLHNDYRNSVAGGNERALKPACRMAQMQWDDELAHLAMLNVKQCTMMHDACHATTTFHYAGQNLAWMSYMPPELNSGMFSKAIDLWYNEVKDVKPSYIDKYVRTDKVIGHFTELVQEKNTHVGCAASTYSIDGEPYDAYLVACNYAYTNVMNQPVYRTCTIPGSKCIQGTCNTYKNLCKTTELYPVNKFYL